MKCFMATMNNPYHSWLIRRKVYCEHGYCMEKGIRVVNVNGKDKVMCDFHRMGPIERGLAHRAAQFRQEFDY